MNKKFVASALVLALALVVGIGSYSKLASASNTSGCCAEGSGLAEKLGIDQEKLDKAMDELREEKRIQKRAEISAGLDEAVKDGKITAEQRQLILDKHNSIESEKRQRGQEMRSWAEENGIDMEILRDYGFGGKRAGKRAGK